MELHFSGELQELEAGLELLAPELGLVFGGGLQIQVCRTAPGLLIKRSKDVAEISYEKPVHFFRGLSLLLQNIDREEFFLQEKPFFKTCGAMFDVSRNAVAKPETVQFFLRKMALMGLDMLMLYTEDTFAVPDEPYFGYLRGRYSTDELKALDDYAAKLGIEVVPCIQTLGHLEQILKWPEYNYLRDTEEILLLESEPTYEFLEKVITTACAPFRTKRIHIGMDEAHKLGLGRYLDLNGYKDRYQLMMEHLRRVLDLAEKLGLEPMMWGDMFFRLGSETADYYDLESRLPPGVKIPENVQLIYWDYYHSQTEFYRDFIRRHRAMGKEPIFAGGIWTWTGHITNYRFTFETTNAALAACKEEGVSEVFATMWNDDGAENNYYTALLGLQLYAEHSWQEQVELEDLKKRFEFCTGACFEQFMDLGLFEQLPGVHLTGSENPTKYLLWQDPLLGLFECHIENIPVAEHYGSLANLYHEYNCKKPDWQHIFGVAEALAAVLALKADLGLRLLNYYKAGDTKKLAQIVSEEIPLLVERVDTLRKLHMKQWLYAYKPFGWEVIDQRYGGLLARLRSTRERLEQYLSGQVASLPELEETRLVYRSNTEQLLLEEIRHRKIISACNC